MSVSRFRFAVLGAILLGINLRGEVPGADKSASVELTSPKEHQVFQRSSPKSGIAIIEGDAAWVENTQTAGIQVRAVSAKEPEREITPWVPLTVGPTNHHFRQEIPLPAGGWYSVEVRIQEGGKPRMLTRVDRIGVGEVFVVAGQSNSANHGEGRMRAESDQVVAFDGTHWQLAADPQPGASGDGGSFIPAFGDALFRHLHVPIGIVATGAGGTSVREWLPKGEAMAAPPTTGANTVTIGTNHWESTGGLYQRLIERGRSIGPTGFRAVLWHQGESDNHQPEGRNITPEQYQEYLRLVIRRSRADWGREVPWFVAQASYHTPEQTGSAELRAAQLAVASSGFALAGPNTDELGIPYRESNGRGVHFNRQGLIRHGELWAEVVSRWLDGM